MLNRQVFTSMDSTLPAKKIRASAVKYNSKLPSNKTPINSINKSRNMVVMESPLEKLYALFLEFDDEVISYFAQPKKFYPYGEDDKKKYYLPDFLVEYVSGLKVYVEVKKDIESLKKDYLKKIELSIELIKKEGCDHKFVTKKDLIIEPYLSNIKLLRRYRGQDISIDAIASGLVLPACRHTTLNELISLNPFREINDFYRLIAHKFFIFDMKSESFDKYSVLSY